MIVRRYSAIVLLLIFVASPATLLSQTPAQPNPQAPAQTPAPQTAQTPAPDPNDPIQRIKDEGMNRSQVMQTLSYLSDVIGPRLTGSPGMKRANEWTRDQLTKWGLQNAHLEAWGPFGRGWTLKRFSAQVAEPTAIPLIAYPKAWSPGLSAPLTADVVYVDAKTEADLEKYKGKLNGKIVLTSPVRDVPAHFDALGTRMNEKDLLTLADAPEPRPTAGRANFGNAANTFRALQQFAGARMRFFDQEGAAVLIDPSRGDGGTIFVQSATAVPPPPNPNATTQPTTNATTQPATPTIYDKNAKIIPQLVLAIEHYNRVVRMLQAGEPVKITVDLAVAWQDADLMGYNTVAEIPGTDLKDEIVMLGGHMDSWHSGTGATDNAAGVSVAMEAVRIIQALGLKPRRTIRIALWSGEEQGLRGSRAYVTEHFGDLQTPPATTSSVPATGGASANTMGGGPGNGNGNGAAAQAATPTLMRKPDYDKFSAYFNLDNGTGKIRGVYLQGNEAVRPIFRQWLAPFRDMGAATLSISNTGGTDHLSYDRIGLPGFQFIQDEIEYDTRTHHSNQDVFDRIQGDDMKQAATIMAAFVYQTAMRDEKLPRKPAPGSR
ncbi:MAG TPA: M20/M25/M40 family metallo-hydrolase [Pyrinomonadaceae bacterium]|nr:M20/M25/M40 family metallo-hydrolase [Pyrinomonadaceae bacterium]